MFKKFTCIAAELKTMADADQLMRRRFQDGTGNWDDDLDKQNTRRLKEIVKEIDWPVLSKVGKDGEIGAWLLVQHADHDLGFQKKCLELMKAAPAGEVDKKHVAFLEDRIAVSEKRQQLYGTQFYKDATGKMMPHPIFDPENLNLRRREVGLEGFEEYRNYMQGR